MLEILSPHYDDVTIYESETAREIRTLEKGSKAALEVVLNLSSLTQKCRFVTADLGVVTIDREIPVLWGLLHGKSILFDLKATPAQQEMFESHVDPSLALPERSTLLARKLALDLFEEHPVYLAEFNKSGKKLEHVRSTRFWARLNKPVI